MKHRPKLVTVETADGGWIVREKGAAPTVLYRWDLVVAYLRDRLTFKPGGGKEGEDGSPE